MISLPAIVPAVLLEQPQVRLPADSNGAPQAIHRRTLMTMGDNPARRRAIFFCSISFTTLGGRVFILRPSEVVAPGASTDPAPSPSNEPESVPSLNVFVSLLLNIRLPRCPTGLLTRMAQNAVCKRHAASKILTECFLTSSFQLQSMALSPLSGCQSCAQGVV